MSAAIIENLSPVMSPEEMAMAFETVVYHGAPWPIGPVEIRRVPRCHGCTAPVEIDGQLCPLCSEDHTRRFGP
jgi:hypothetical protein